MEVKDVANYLLNHCYIMGEVEETKDRYYYAINHLEELKKAVYTDGIYTCISSCSA